MILLPAAALLVMTQAWLAPAAEAVKSPAPYSRASARVQSLWLGKTLAAEARKLLGTPYVWGGKDPQTGFDCSGLTRYVYGRAGLELPLSAAGQFMAGQGVQLQALQPGDLVFFTSSSPPATMHVGIYEGGGVFIHAPRSGTLIQRGRMDKPYFARRFLGARRLDPVLDRKSGGAKAREEAKRK